jgi:His-Xaa-Ser system protein HxsD
VPDHASSISSLVLKDGRIDLRLDIKVYRLTAIQKAAYKLAKHVTVAIGALEGDLAAVTLLFRPATTEPAALECARSFFQELLDQELREKIGNETAPLRSLIIAQAFSRTDLIRRD